jgi:hypothetical protein
MAQSIPSMRVMMGSIAVALLIAGPNSRLSAQPPSGRGGDSRVVELNRLLVIIASKARVSTIPSSSNPLATVSSATSPLAAAARSANSSASWRKTVA